MSDAGRDGLWGMLNSRSTYSVSTLPIAREIAPAPSRDQGVAIASHTFATPVVREVSRPAPEPLAFAATW
jgi:hypothetical protein